MNIVEVTAELRTWVGPRYVAGNPFRLSCSVEDGATQAELVEAWNDSGLPSELSEFWRGARTARLFEDVDHGQWGLVVLSPKDSARRTVIERQMHSDDVRPSDIIVGEFLGDQELLVVARDEGDSVLVALPLDPRSDWHRVSPSLVDFLVRYMESNGDKFWQATR